MAEKLTIMSLSLPPTMQEELKNTAKKVGWSVSKVVRALVEKHLSSISVDGTNTSADKTTCGTVILKIPSSLRGDKDGLRKWLDVKTEAIVNALKEKVEK